jgi:hypothetical protein
MQVQTQKQIKILQTEAKNVANKLNKEVVVVTKGVQHIQAQVGIVYLCSYNFLAFSICIPFYFILLNWK